MVRWVALELARELEQDGERVACLVILDTTAPDPTQERPEPTERQPLADLVVVFEELSGQMFGLSREAIQAETDTSGAYALVMAAFQRCGVLFSQGVPVADSRRCLRWTLRRARPMRGMWWKTPCGHRSTCCGQAIVAALRPFRISGRPGAGGSAPGLGSWWATYLAGPSRCWPRRRWRCWLRRWEPSWRRARGHRTLKPWVHRERGAGPGFRRRLQAMQGRA